jgi:hypothetical protein
MRNRRLHERENEKPYIFDEWGKTEKTTTVRNRRILSSSSLEKHSVAGSSRKALPLHDHSSFRGTVITTLHRQPVLCERTRRAKQRKQKTQSHRHTTPDQNSAMVDPILPADLPFADTPRMIVFPPAFLLAEARS